ncbi:unnamed protein product (macronuclear) [Paramecium tetraurelia]|uniref:Uncharacterized protein n=1 Tax=Paramecium tetraurelia TaxID=5888 RepID=A0DYB2_PARTE|nr:uncharacterized protein GSPATT00002997001 [Paramecium tetraurelia]CAK88029.1 unnamed protein product [Paramecium tetraurelia]|eukprot:XP_001455426.1 hypothetical protein (macronuclear) [Paramecium tetraurelia strain d4-2]
MGSSFCFQASQKSRDELKLITNKQYKLNGPPHLFKPTPIVKILIFDEQIEKEESIEIETLEQPNNPINDQQFSYIAQQSEEIDGSQSKPWIKKTYALETINVSNIKSDENYNNAHQYKNSEKERNIYGGKAKNLKEAQIISIQQGSNISVSSDKKQLKNKTQNRIK